MQNIISLENKVFLLFMDISKLQNIIIFSDNILIYFGHNVAIMRTIYYLLHFTHNSKNILVYLHSMNVENIYFFINRLNNTKYIQT